MSLAKRFVFIVSVVLLAAFITADAPFYAQNTHHAQIGKQMMMASASATQNGITVMTYNIHHGRDMSGRDNLDSIVQEIRLSGAQIIALQEVDRYMPRSGFKDQVKYIADQLSMYYAYGKTIDILSIEYGNAVISAFPILKRENIILPGSSIEPRALLKTEIAVGNDIYNVWATHLGLLREDRFKQIDAINAALAQESKPTILLGDFNNICSSDEISDISDRLKDVAALLGKGDAGTYAYGDNAPNVRIDYIWVTDDILPVEYHVNLLGLSDHASVVAKLLLNGKKNF
ncbi:endonuclease/exonuclease/phosphatase family protein [Mahella australiensis]|uniref:Endonuclease/exonuclease/phosphatase n=1 Tax=Mahella australiensis (strain DSM 15567 / CIP 107919 / 50-1 BON) TaxID=697281 RepID=F4A352_MAHA5|nr:endonuclease/exonuclease/phosphatase family protein [Mahella australiensis]AEE96285.1 Endonuclease/exonuclease/phosphatase [Mahella australiensis 50-1 BON]